MPVSATPRTSMRSPLPRLAALRWCSSRTRTAITCRALRRFTRDGQARSSGSTRGRFAIRMWAGRWLADGAVVETDEGPLSVLHTPGHAPDHLTFWHAESRTLFVGDMLVQGSTVVIPASHGGSLAEYLRFARAHAAAQSGARVAGARPGDRRSGGADSPATSNIARSAKRRCSARWRPASRPSNRSPGKSTRRSSTHWCRWRARACSRICRSSKANAGSRATATAGSSSSGTDVYFPDQASRLSTG